MEGVIILQCADDIFDAINKRDQRAVKLMLSKGADINGRNEEGFTPLFIAVMNDDAKMVRLLISNGADLNGRDEQADGAPVGATPLFSAKSGKVAEILIAAGADVNARDDSEKQFWIWLMNFKL